ncbi:AAA family ATPase [Candidatus Woesearchaeota archaeon]|nr:AAA family ATPase [Candidatus Woesearchaeota archaeon]
MEPATKDIIHSETIVDAKQATVEEENLMMGTVLKRLEQETIMLREMFNNVNDELTNLKKPALLVGDVVHVLPNRKCIIRLPNGNKFYVHVIKEVQELKTGDSVLIDQKALNVVGHVNHAESLDVEKFIIMQKPQETWEQIGGLQSIKEELKEVIELPLKKPELFERVGIKPPKGVLLYGPPGTGKTLLAKAVAKSTDATFIEVTGSELVQKFIGEGAKLVKDIFELARKKAPTILFIDEIDALAATRMDIGTSGEREVNRTFMQLLSELDGFKHLGNVKVIAATNRPDILDQALIRPGRLDRLIEVGLPNEESRLEILKVHTAQMSLKAVKLKEMARLTEDFSGAELRAACTEAGYFAIREGRNHVTTGDFQKAIEKIKLTWDEEEEGKMFG